MGPKDSAHVRSAETQIQTQELQSWPVREKRAEEVKVQEYYLIEDPMQLFLEQYGCQVAGRVLTNHCPCIWFDRLNRRKQYDYKEESQR